MPDAAPGNDDDFPRENRCGAALAQLGLLEVPVFDLEKIRLRQRVPAAEAFGAHEHVDAVIVKLGHDRGVLRRAARRGQSECGIERHARRRIEHGFLFLGMRRIALEVGAIARRVLCDVAADHRQRLGADDVVGRGRPLLRNPADLGVLRKGAILFGIANGDDHRIAGRCGQVVPELGNLLAIYAGTRLRLVTDAPALALVEIRLDLADQRDHALVGLPRIVAERKDAVVHEHHADRVLGRLFGEFARADRSQVESRHDIGNDHHAVGVDFANALFAVGSVGHRQHSVRMRVVDVARGQDAVQDGFDRRRGRACACHVRGELVDHLRIGKRGQGGKPADVAEPHRRETGRLDGLEIPAAAFHVEDLFFLAEQVPVDELDGGIAAAMEHQRFIPAEQAGRVDARPEGT